MNPIPKDDALISSPVIGALQYDAPQVVEIPGYGTDHKVVVDEQNQIWRGYKPSTAVVEGKGIQQLGGFLSFEELDQALGIDVPDADRNFQDSDPCNLPCKNACY